MMTRDDYKWFGKSGTFLLMLNIKPIPILKYQAITDAKNQGKVSFLNRILTETQYKCNIMSCMGQKKRE